MKWLFKPRDSFSIAEFVLICTGAFLVIYRVSGRSPIVLYDTALEESFVQWCLQERACPLYGGPTNLAGFWQGGAWIYLRTFFSWLGLDPGAVHLLLQALDALAIGLIAVCGAMLHSRLAGVAAAAVAVWLLPLSEITIGLHNSRFMFFPATLVTLLCLTAVRSRKTLPLYLAAAAAAAAVNVHAACIPLVISVALVGALRSDRRAPAFFFWGGIAGLATLLLSPGVWSYHLASLLSPGDSIISPASSFELNLGIPEITAVLAALILAARCVLQPLPSTEKHCTRALLAVLLPGLLLLAFLGAFLGVGRSETYLSFLMPAFSLALASAGLWVLGQLEPLAGRLAGAGAAAAHTIAPGVLGATLIVAAAWGNYPTGPRLLFEDLEELEQQLDFLGWDLDNRYRHVKYPQEIELLATLLAYSPIKSSAIDEEDAGENLYVFKAPATRLPDVPRGEWSTIPRDDGSALVMVRAPTWLDWKNFSACIGTSCVDSGLRYSMPDYLQLAGDVPGLAYSGRVRNQHFQVRFPVRIPPGSGEHALIAPELEHGCRGRFVSVPEGNSRILPGEGRALLVAGDEPVAGTLVLQWTPGSRECPETAYSGLPPFFIEAETGTAGQIERLFGGEF